MKLKIIDSFEKITLDEIYSQQDYLNFSFPKEYVEFLLKNNGGIPNKNIFRTLFNEYETELSIFFGITNKPTFDLKSVNLLLKGRIPIDTISIGSDNLGNHILINEKDEIFFYDHETDDVVYVCNSLSSFLSSLFSYENEIPTEFELAVLNQDLSYLRKKLEEGKLIDDIKNESGRTITQMAAAQNKAKLLKFCLDNGANISKTLYLASINNNVNIMKYLILKGADLNEIEGTDNETTFIATCHYGNLEAAKILVNAGVDIAAEDIHGNNALNKAYWSDNQELIDYLEQEVYTN